MPKNPDKLTLRLIELLDEDPGQTVKQLAQQLGVNRTYLAGYLKALENKDILSQKELDLQEYILKRI